MRTLPVYRLQTNVLELCTEILQDAQDKIAKGNSFYTEPISGVYYELGAWKNEFTTQWTVRHM